MVLYEGSGLRLGASVAAVHWAQAAMTLFPDETSPTSPRSRVFDPLCVYLRYAFCLNVYWAQPLASVSGLRKRADERAHMISGCRKIWTLPVSLGADFYEL